MHELWGVDTFSSMNGPLTSLVLKRAGSPVWRQWVLPEEDGIAHIKAAYVSIHRDYAIKSSFFIPHRYDAGINTFDTANVSQLTHFQVPNLT
jgi:hypothetical protein